MNDNHVAANEDLDIFMTCCPELFRDNEIVLFRKFFCPISIIEADVKEYIVDEYESVELLTLRLYSAGIKDTQTMSKLTGIDVNMIEKLLKTEVYTYNHINPATGELTPAGKQTLEDNKDTDNIYQHALYNVKREIQADALTGTIIRYEAEISKDQMFPFSDDYIPFMHPLDCEEIDAELEREIRERLQKYIEEGFFSEGNTINDIGELKTREIRYREVYYVKMEKFEYPFLALSYLVTKENGPENVIFPIALAKSDFDSMDCDANNEKYLVRDDEAFYHLYNCMDLFEECDEFDEDIADEFKDIDDDRKAEIDIVEEVDPNIDFNELINNKPI